MFGVRKDKEFLESKRIGLPTAKGAGPYVLVLQLLLLLLLLLLFLLLFILLFLMSCCCSCCCSLMLLLWRRAASPLAQ